MASVIFCSTPKFCWGNILKSLFNVILASLSKSTRRHNFFIFFNVFQQGSFFLFLLLHVNSLSCAIFLFVIFFVNRNSIFLLLDLKQLKHCAEMSKAGALDLVSGLGGKVAKDDVVSVSTSKHIYLSTLCNSIILSAYMHLDLMPYF